MIFLPVTLTLIPPTIPALVLILILSREELQVSAGYNSGPDGRFSFEDSNCPQNWKAQLELEPELERPTLELWAQNGTKLLDHPSSRVIHMGEDYEADYSVGFMRLMMMCKAPYPVILLAAFEEGLAEIQYDVFDVTTTGMYNRSSYNFETRTTYLPSDFVFEDHFDRKRSRNNIFYCEAVDNSCLKSGEKLFYFYEKSAEVMIFTLRYYSFSSDSDSDSDLSFDSDSNSTLNPNSSSISPSEIKSLFGTNLNWNLNLNVTVLNSSSTDHDGHKKNNTNNDSECEAFFYYEVFGDNNNNTFSGGEVDLRYFCEFLDGTPGTVQDLQRCNTWGRCRFLVAARKQKAKNCWRPYIAGKTCLNCSYGFLEWSATLPFIPHCSNENGEHEAGDADVREAMEEDRATEKPEIDDDLENWTTQKSTETKVNTGDDDGTGKSPMSMYRSVEGTPLYVGFPPPGFQIQRPSIRTDAYGQDDLEESTLVRMNPFAEIQLFNTSIQITCDSHEYYTSKTIFFALEFESKEGKRKGVQPNLQFFPADKTNLGRYVRGAGNLNSQALTIHLNRTDLRRIFCFAGVQNSYQWINASRPIRVLEYHDFYKPSECLDKGETDENPDSYLYRPKLSVSYTSRDTVEFDEDNPILLLNDDATPTLTCSAYYPIQVLSTFNDTTGKGIKAYKLNEFDFIQVRPVNLFKLVGFEFSPERESHFYRCQSLENPCLHRSIFYSYVPGPTGQLKFEHVPQNHSDRLTKDGTRSIANSNIDSALELKLEFGSPANYPECQVLFFYKELEDFRGYEFRCEFPLKEEGKVKFHYCDSLNDCANRYRNRRQSKMCWRKVESWRDCSNCKEVRSDGFRPFVATCTTYFFDNGEPKVIESAFGNFAVFGLPNQTNGIAPIYFSNEEIIGETTIFLKPFEKYQLFDTSLTVTCVSSAYYMNTKDLHIVKFYGERNEFEYFEYAKINSGRPNLDPERHEFRITRNIQLGNDSSLTHIFCTGVTWINARTSVNFSREIHLQGPEVPKVILDAGNFEETFKNPHSHGAVNSEMSSVEQEYEFVVNSENQRLVCHAHGFPPPAIEWVTTARNSPKPQETEVNSAHSVSRIFLPLIDAGVKGTYICTAMNSHGTAKASMRVSLKYPVNKTLVAIVTSSVLIFMGFSILVALLWRRNRGLMKQMRDLTLEEVEEFHKGSRTVNPDNPDEDYAVMTDCWQKEPSERPTFQEIHDRLVLIKNELN